MGSIEWISGFGIQISEADLRKYNEMAEHGCTTVALVIDNILCGFIGIADLIRENAAASIRDINNLKINKIMMLTGDNTLPAKYVANQVGINEYVAQQLPEGKANTIRQIQDKGFTVAMIGDGVNDAPSLATADVGIAMGISGTDVAVETANIALLSDDLSKIPGIISLSRNTLAVINQNIWFANGINLISIILASSGILGPILAAIVHNLSAIVVILNSSRLIKSKI
ncbi:hypothetical protein N752_11595 [Desulforamulus aquiferis]|nr:hypothetical protein N752_11595 [Desulforamulus aquiferis]